jgi:amidohydrolase
MLKSIQELSNEIEAQLKETRREIHKNPELSLSEYKTAALVAKKLEVLGLEVAENIGETGVVGLLKGKEPGKTIALRADIDALPIEEQTGHDFKSHNKQVMHACGHDAHTAILLGVAEILVRLKDTLKGNVKFIFQPGEEKGLGADRMIDEGVMQQPEVDAALALHVTPELPAGQIGYREGPFFATVAFFEIEIIGKGGHGAMPHHSINPILIAAECVQALQMITSSKINPMEPFVLTIGSFNGGQSPNIIPEKVRIEGTTRCFDDKLMDQTEKAIEKIIASVTAAHGATYNFKFNKSVRTVINDKQMIALVKEAAEEIVGQEKTVFVPQVLLGDDFGSFSQLVPSAYVYLGIGFEDRVNYPLHHPKFDLDERALPMGAALLSYATLKYLGSTGV